MDKANCAFTECDRSSHTKGLCHSHYKQQWKGQTLRPLQPRGRDIMERFTEKYVVVKDCWVWTANKTHDGYALFWDGSAKVYAHRWSYGRFVGPVPAGHEVDHICHNTSCVNPEHLRPVSPKQNQEHMRGPQSNSTTGVRGVYWDSSKSRFRAYVSHYGKSIYAGVYKTLAEADAGVRAKRAELYTHDDADSWPVKPTMPAPPHPHACRSRHRGRGCTR